LKKLIQLSLLLALTLGYSFQSQAALLIEPVLGYNVSTKLDIEDVDNYSGGTGAAFGGRLGYQNFGLQVGIDYLRSSIDMHDDVFDKNVTMSEWAGFVGYEFPLFLRVYAGYIFSATGETEMGGLDADFSEGSGTKMGVGFTGLPFVDINFEFRTGKFDKYEASGIELDQEVKYQSIMVGISVPFTI